MQTNSDFILREIVDEYMLLPTGEASQTLNGMIRLTETAAFIWRQVDTAKDLKEIIDNLVREYDIEEIVAHDDVYGFLYEFYTRGIVSDIPEFEKKLQQNLGDN